MQDNDIKESTNDVTTLLSKEEKITLVISNENLQKEPPVLQASFQYKQSTNLSMSELSTLLTR